MRLLPRLLGVLALGLAFSQACSAAEDLPRYQLDVELTPATHLLAVEASVVLPESLAGKSVEFLLAEPLTIESATPAVTRLPLEGAAGFEGINGSSTSQGGNGHAARYRVQLPAGQRTLKLRYRGPIAFPLEAPVQEYARGFTETMGTIGPEGVYLAGSTLWYPYLGDGLFSFALTARAPEGWQLVSPGNGTSRDAAGVAHWSTDLPLDELHIVGGPLQKAVRSAGAVRAEVYLRTPDDALAAKYLEATARYIEMYRNLIGPYPYEKFALVENFWETGYGMPSFTLLGSQIIRFPFILTSSYPHEILHNWWGNSVFVDYATGNWCEGLTAYLADHLIKEQEHQGAEYRRDTLKKYRDFVRDGHDFPLREFRSRHSPATEAVGYGKTLMLAHMVRRQIGDDAFRAGLQRFNRDNNGKRASFTDLRLAMEAVSKADLARLFTEQVDRAGAPDLRLAGVAVRKASDGYTVTGRVEQVQPGALYGLDVPIAVSTNGVRQVSSLRLEGRSTSFSLHSATPPELVEVDPEFDVFRLLDARETAPSLGQMFGDNEVLVVLPSAAPAAVQDAYRKMAEFWGGGTQHFTYQSDAETKALPADRAVWVMGRDNRLAARWFDSSPALGFSVDAEGVTARGERIRFEGQSAVVVRRHPANPLKAIGWIVADPLDAAPGLARKLPHYGKYSYLGFEGRDAASIVKGEWPASDSPLRADVRPAGARNVPLVEPPHDKRAALAQVPTVFDPAQLKAHVEFLAAPEQEGRAVGTAGLDAAAAYVEKAFRAAGLAPAVTGGGYVQEFDITPSGAKAASRARNIIGVLPGANPAFDGQSIVVSAHYDHLGRSGRGVRVAELGQVHPGADDNASGVAVLLELARVMASGERPPRTIVFIAFSGEEEGLVGSRHFVEHPLGLTLEGLRAVVNLDTVGRLSAGELTALATGTAMEWPHVFRGITATTGVPIRSIAGAAESSDQQSFIARGIPGVQLFTGAHLDYHRPTDTADKIDTDGLVKVAMVTREALGYLAQRPTPLTVTIEQAPADAARPPAAAAGATPERRVSFGIVPAYEAVEGGGVLAESVVPGSPAALAGIEAGDIVTHLKGEPVRTLAEFSTILKSFAPGETVQAKLRRGDKLLEKQVKLVAR